MEQKFTVGIDFGTLSGRCVLVDVSTGREVATAVSEYAHKVMDTALPDGTPLQIDWALQHPQDYLDVLRTTIRQVVADARIKPEQIIGVGVDFTSCTVLPILNDGTPLCMLEQYRDRPHAYVKLWKHHAAQTYADRLNQVAARQNQPFLNRYGGKISSEWLFPKLWQILDEDPDIYNRMDCFMEACDWVVMQLTGTLQRCNSAAGYKAMWSSGEGFPPDSFFAALDPRLEHVVAKKITGTIVPIGSKAGEITPAASALTGLPEGIAVAVGHMDAAGAMVGAGITGPGSMLAVMGTSTCHMLMGNEIKDVPGICGWVDGGQNPGLIGYEAGQSCVGDHFQWVVERCVDQKTQRQAELEGKSIHLYLSEKAAAKEPGESGLVALDWWNGNRSVLVDGSLSGLILGCTLQTRPEDIYRALVEATAFGTRKIVETFTQHGVEIRELIIAGGIAKKNPFIMHTYADIIGKPVHIAGSTQNPALSSAIWASLAAGSQRGGYDNLDQAVDAMSNQESTVYHPDPEKHAVYNQLYREYTVLHDYFGRGENQVMKRLKKIAEGQRAKKMQRRD